MELEPFVTLHRVAGRSPLVSDELTADDPLPPPCVMDANAQAKSQHTRLTAVYQETYDDN